MSTAMDSIETATRSIERLKKRLQKRLETFNKAQRADGDELQKLVRSRYREMLKLLVGVPNGVQVSARHGNDRKQNFDDLYGTLIEVRREWCHVDFDGKTWRFPIMDITYANAPQACSMRCMFDKRPESKVIDVELPARVQELVAANQFNTHSR